MKKLFLIITTTLLFSCSTDDNTKRPIVIEDCNCEVEHWLRTPVPNQIGYYTWELIYAEPIEFDCINNESNVFYTVSNASYNQDRVVCEGIEKQ